MVSDAMRSKSEDRNLSSDEPWEHKSEDSDADKDGDMELAVVVSDTTATI